MSIGSSSYMPYVGYLVKQLRKRQATADTKDMYQISASLAVTGAAYKMFYSRKRTAQHPGLQPDTRRQMLISRAEIKSMQWNPGPTCLLEWLHPCRQLMNSLRSHPSMPCYCTPVRLLGYVMAKPALPVPMAAVGMLYQPCNSVLAICHLAFFLAGDLGVLSGLLVAARVRFWGLLLGSVPGMLASSCFAPFFGRPFGLGFSSGSSLLSSPSSARKAACDVPHTQPITQQHAWPCQHACSRPCIVWQRWVVADVSLMEPSISPCGDTCQRLQLHQCSSAEQAAGSDLHQKLGHAARGHGRPDRSQPLPARGAWSQWACWGPWLRRSRL